MYFSYLRLISLHLCLIFISFHWIKNLIHLWVPFLWIISASPPLLKFSQLAFKHTPALFIKNNQNSGLYNLPSLSFLSKPSFLKKLSTYMLSPLSARDSKWPSNSEMWAESKTEALFIHGRSSASGQERQEHMWAFGKKTGWWGRRVRSWALQFWL